MACSGVHMQATNAQHFDSNMGCKTLQTIKHHCPGSGIAVIGVRDKQITCPSTASYVIHIIQTHRSRAGYLLCYLVFICHKIHAAVCGTDLKSKWLVDDIFSAFD